jgi:large subunit ribosomal protein L29
MAAKKKAKATKAAPQKATGGKRLSGKSHKHRGVLAKLRAKSPEDLADELLKLRKEQFALRLQRATGQAPKPNQFGAVRKNIARSKTIAREAQLKAAAGVTK